MSKWFGAVVFTKHLCSSLYFWDYEIEDIQKQFRFLNVSIRHWIFSIIISWISSCQILQINFNIILKYLKTKIFFLLFIQDLSIAATLQQEHKQVHLDHRRLSRNLTYHDKHPQSSNCQKVRISVIQTALKYELVGCFFLCYWCDSKILSSILISN